MAKPPPEYSAYDGDPLRPDLIDVTPPALIARLTQPEREQRVEWLIQQAYDIVNMAWEQHGTGRQLIAKCVLFSGGNDSTVLTHLFKDRVDYAVHCNTTIGIEQTRQFVRDTCKLFNLELLERVAPVSYREFVLGQHFSKDGKQPYPGGFPGPQAHFFMFSRLKERALEQVRRELVANPRRERVIFIAGRRRSESKRRQSIKLSDRRGSSIYASPLAMWTKLDMNTYRLMQDGRGELREGEYQTTVRDAAVAAELRGVPVNEVSELLHMSGECLCGAFAHDGELEEIRMWFPDVAAEIDALMAEVKAAGFEFPYNTWGHRKGAPSKKTGLMCSSCEFTEGQPVGGEIIHDHD